jgi:hypothetical protein
MNAESSSSGVIHNSILGVGPLVSPARKGQFIRTLKALMLTGFFRFFPEPPKQFKNDVEERLHMLQKFSVFCPFGLGDEV